MRWRYREKARTFSAAEDGVVAMEFVILFPLFMLIIVGIVEFGHLFYVRHTLTNASREGARAAVVYNVGARDTWAIARAKTAVDKYLLDTKFFGTYTVTTTAGTQTGDLVTVTIASPSGLMFLDNFISAFKDLEVSAETTMRME